MAPKINLTMLDRVCKAAFRAARTEDIAAVMRQAVLLALAGARTGALLRFRSISSTAPSTPRLCRSLGLLRACRSGARWTQPPHSCVELAAADLGGRRGDRCRSERGAPGAGRADRRGRADQRCWTGLCAGGPCAVPGLLQPGRRRGCALGESDLLLAVGTRLRGNETRGGSWRCLGRGSRST